MPADLKLSEVGRALIADRTGAPPEPEVVADLERLIRSFVTVPLEQCQFDGLAGLLRDVGPGRIARSLGPDDPGKPGLFMRRDGKPTIFLETLDRGDYRAVAHSMTGWRRKDERNELDTYRWRLAQMLTFEGLPYTAALNACHSLTFQIEEAERIAREQKADLDAIKPREPTITVVTSGKPAPRPMRYVPPPVAVDVTELEAEVAAPEPPQTPQAAPVPTPTSAATVQLVPPQVKHPVFSGTIWLAFVLAFLPSLEPVADKILGHPLAGPLGEAAKILAFAFLILSRAGAAAALSIHAPIFNKRNP
jgi:hypothetical protein